VQAGVYLGWLGDPRPGVCTLPPDMVRIEGGEFVIGSTAEEAEETGKAYEQYHLDQGNADIAGRARKWPEDEINDQPLVLPAFEIARYLLTNAQYELFIKDQGYDPDASWWDEAGRAWLHEAGRTQPLFWDDERFGIARPNQPVGGISWYEAMAFCRWLSQHHGYNPAGYTYTLPSEAEWEYAACRATRRTYPWGSEEPDGERANFYDIYGGTTAVGCFPAGATPEDHIHDLAGNVWEWTHNASQNDAPTSSHERKTTGHSSKPIYPLHGGGWHLQSMFIRTSYHRRVSANIRSRLIGFRLVRYPPDKA
jgi:formylglycine-generating enzyme required for sulfatase activity